MTDLMLPRLKVQHGIAKVGGLTFPLAIKKRRFVETILAREMCGTIDSITKEPTSIEGIWETYFNECSLT